MFFINCNKCGLFISQVEKLMGIETELAKYYYCISCIKQAQGLLSMKMYLNKDERALLKKMRRFLKRNGEYEKN